MARRVKQADGSYCYTENCRIHDRSGDSTGLQAVLNDAKISRLNSFVSTTSVALQEQFNLREEEATSIGARAIEGAMNSENGVTAYTISEGIKDAARAEGMDPTGLDTLPAAYMIHSDMINTALIKPGDEVILNDTGERGTIAEGSSAFGGSVRFNPENIRSRNSFAWFDPSDVTKIIPNDKAPARAQIMAIPRDYFVPAKLIKQLFEEESSKNTPNAQAAKEFGRSGKAAKENLEKFGTFLSEKYGDHGMTKSNLLSAISEMYDKPVAREMSDSELKATKGGLRAILTYLDPTGSYRD
jgi:hypothetical protein